MSEWSEHFYALASAAVTALWIVVIVFVFLPLFVLIYIPHPKLIAEYREILSELQTLIFGLMAAALLSVIFGYISSRLAQRSDKKDNIYNPPLSLFSTAPPHCEGGSVPPQPAGLGAHLPIFPMTRPTGEGGEVVRVL
jgi:H+/gluconate symporter-like permease